MDHEDGFGLRRTFFKRKYVSDDNISDESFLLEASEMMERNGLR